MSAGLHTRNKLHAALHPDIHGDVVNAPSGSVMGDSPVSERSRTSALSPQSSPLTERRGSWPARMGIDADTLFGYKRYRDDEEIPEVSYVRSAHGLGTPGEVARDREQRLEQLYDRAFRIGGAIIVILVAFGGYGYVARRDEPSVSGDVAYYVKAQSLRVGQRACELDQHEGCLVCMHRDTSGITLVSHHC